MSALGKKNAPLQDDFSVFVGATPITGLTSFTFELWNPLGVNVAGTIVPVVTELGGGLYRVVFTPDLVGDWILVVYNTPYFVEGKRENYQVYENLFDDIAFSNLGPGNRTVEITVQDSMTLGPIIAAWVEVYDVTSTVRIAFAYTGATGKITFQLFDGNYKVYISKIGEYVFTVPEDLTVTADPPPPDVAVTYQGTPFDPGTPPSPDLCIVYGWQQDAQGNGLAVEVTAKIAGDDNFLISDPHIMPTEITVTSSPTHVNGPGYWSMALMRSGQFASGPRTVLYEFTIGDMVKTVEIPDLPTVAFSTLVDP